MNVDWCALQTKLAAVTAERDALRTLLNTISANPTCPFETILLSATPHVTIDANGIRIAQAGVPE